MSEVDVLVVGAGPTGCMLGIELASRGIRVRVIDKAEARPTTSRALVVQARSMELFDRHGLAADLVSRGAHAIDIEGYVRRERFGRFTIGEVGASDTPFGYLLFLSQVETERALEAALARLGTAVERPSILLSAHDAGDHVDATLATPRGEEHVRARYLVGADGAHSVVRKLAGLSFEGAAYPQTFALADVRVDGPIADGAAHFFFGSPGLLVVLPIDAHGTHRLIASGFKLRGEGDADPTLAEMQAIYDEVSPVASRFHDPSWLARFRLHHRGVDRYRHGRLFVAGDAAHIHSPAGGQGMNTGLQDAANLGWKLALVLRGAASDALLESYHAERYPVGRMLLGFTDRLFRVAASANPLLLGVRNAIVPFVAPRFIGRPAGRARLFRFISQLGIRYRRSAVVAEGPGGAFASKSVRPGDRMPDARIGETTLFTMLRGTSHHLIMVGGDGASLARAAAALEARFPKIEMRVHAVDSGELRERLGVIAPAQVLVRPDGYVGFRAPGHDASAVIAHLVRTYEG
jgi:2-polyprenyl-6-methoxyphenol hydroxylase-like FAD-dependent oxidoreductase